MHSANHWGGSLEIADAEHDYDDHSDNLDPAAVAPQQHLLELDETQQSWLLGPRNDENERKKKYVDLGCFIVKRNVLKWVLATLFIAFLVIGIPVIVVNAVPKHKSPPPPPDDYSKALKKALLFFNAQKSGRLPKNNGVPWRGDSGLKDGSDLTDVKGGLVGGYYDAGDNIKFHFPMAFSMTMLSWSVVEYGHKYKEIGEYEHVRDIIKWGTDYLMKTFNSSASTIDKVYSQVGTARNGSTSPDDHYCWTRPEDMTYPRPVSTSTSAPDLGAEIAAALASASIVFRDNPTYSTKLVSAATTVYTFARRQSHRTPYSQEGTPNPFYNSTGFWDEYMWSAGWMYYATGNNSYVSFATNMQLGRNARAFKATGDFSVLSWDNKLPAAELLWTRLRIFLNPGYPYEEALSAYHNLTGLNMCSYLQQFQVFNWTKGGLIQLNHGGPQPLQYAANAAFLASLYADYMDATDVPGWSCGPNYFAVSTLRSFASSQLDYILGHNPSNLSYVVGYGTNYPKHVHHRGASIPNDGKKYSCTGGYKWRDSKKGNPNELIGAMVGGPDRFDQFRDVRREYGYTEPTLAGNAGLVAALVASTTSGGDGVDRNVIFSALPSMYPADPPPPPPWKP